MARGLEEMSTLAPQGSPLPPQAISASFAKLKLIVLSLGSAGATEPSELRAGFRRELARLALADAVGGRAIPSWFAEGFVLHFSRDGEWTREWMLYGASVRHRLHARPISTPRSPKADRGGVGRGRSRRFASFLKPENARASRWPPNDYTRATSSRVRSLRLTARDSRCSRATGPPSGPG